MDQPFIVQHLKARTHMLWVVQAMCGLNGLRIAVMLDKMHEPDIVAVAG
jgi:hypothetical protein